MMQTDTALHTPTLGDDLSVSVSADAAGRVTVHYAPSPGMPPPDRAGIEAALRSAGFGDYFRLEADISAFLNKSAEVQGPASAVVAEKRDAKGLVEITADKMRVLLTITPPYGGKRLERDEIMASLAHKNVCVGIDQEAIDAALASQSAQRLTVAEGEPAVDGEDGHLSVLVLEAKERKPKINEQGLADFRDLGSVATVEAGAPLMRRTPPTPGKNGRNVLGEVLLAKPGKDVQFAGGLGGAAASPEDPNTLVAAIVGQPVVQRDGVTVDPVLTLEDVDIRSGNVEFKGTLHVKNDIANGMRVRVDGDVVVGGVVEAANIEAGGDVIVRGGIVGHPGSRNRDGKSTGDMPKISAGHSVQAKFIENAIISAGNDVMVEDAIILSDVSAAGRVIVGRQGATKGYLMGGNVTAAMLIKTPVLGAPGSGETHVMVGVNPATAQRICQLADTIERKAAERSEVEKLVTFLKAHPEKGTELLEKAERTRDSLGQEIGRLMDEHKALAAEVQLAEKARVEVTKLIDGSVRICIGPRCTHTPEHREAGVFFLKDGEIYYGD